MAQQTSNKRELVAIDMALQAFQPLLIREGISSIQILTDNSTAMYNINRKAASWNLYLSLRRLLIRASREGFQLKADHIPGVLNQETDALSRMESSGDYCLAGKSMDLIQKRFNLFPEVDLFANKENHQMRLWCGLRAPRKNDVAAEGYLGNAWNINWNQLRALIHPPIPLIVRVLEKYVREEGGPSLLVLPDWKGQVWTPLLKQVSRGQFLLGPMKEHLYPGPGMKKRDLLLPPGNLVCHLIGSSQRAFKFWENYRGYNSQEIHQQLVPLLTL
jgi:hypothetical protein